jgi:hypothetical protein
MKQTPVSIGLFLCEQVIIEEKTGNVTPVNCFTRRKVSGFPSEPVPFVVFALLTDGLGEMPLEVSLERLDTMEELFRTVLPYRFVNPLREVRFILRVRGYSFPVPGHYQLSLFAENELLAHRKLVMLPEETTP